MTLFGKPVIITGTPQEQAECERKITEEAKQAAKRNPIQLNGDGTWGPKRDVVLHSIEELAALKGVKLSE